MTKGLVGIIGGAGAMGLYWAELFQNEGYSVVISDIKTEKAEQVADEKGFEFRAPIELMLQRLPCFDAMMFSVLPITETYNVIENYARLVKPGGLLTDVTSVKVKPVKCMLQNAPEDVEVIGMHPMFRPDLSMEGQTVIITPTMPAEKSIWLPKLEEIVKNNKGLVTTASAEDHDFFTAFIQGLVHASSMATLETIRDSNVSLELLSKFSSPVYRMFLDLSSRIVSGQAELYGDLQTENPKWMGFVLGKFCGTVEGYTKMVQTSESSDDKTKFVDFYNALKRFVQVYNESAKNRLEGLVGKQRDIQLFFEGKYSENISELLRLPKLKISKYETLTIKERTIEIATANIETGHISKLQKQQDYFLAQYTARLDLGKRPSHVVFYIRNTTHPSDSTRLIRFSPIASETPDRDESVKKKFVREQLRNTYLDPISNIFHTCSLIDYFTSRPLIVYKSNMGKQ